MKTTPAARITHEDSQAVTPSVITPAAVYGSRHVVAGFTGTPARLERIEDGAPVAGLDIAALLAFATPREGYRVRYYDQNTSGVDC